PAGQQHMAEAERLARPDPKLGAKGRIRGRIAVLVRDGPDRRRCRNAAPRTPFAERGSRAVLPGQGLAKFPERRRAPRYRDRGKRRQRCLHGIADGVGAGGVGGGTTRRAASILTGFSSNCPRIPPSPLVGETGASKIALTTSIPTITSPKAA